MEHNTEHKVINISTHKTARSSLSVLLPTFNCRCTELVMELHRQLSEWQDRHNGFTFEIIVGDDGSDRSDMIAGNRVIETLPCVRYIINKKNIGRSRMRNMLAATAKSEWLLFVDGDRTLKNNSFIERYLESSGMVVEGSVAVAGTKRVCGGNLRWLYEKAGEKALKEDRIDSSQQFCSTNFLISRQLMLDFPFDSRFTTYGYEDVMLGKTLTEHGIKIERTDNPITIDSFETNQQFVRKTEEAIRTLWHFRKELCGYSHLLGVYKRVDNCGARPFLRIAYRLTAKHIKSVLEGNKPCVFLFNIYKLLYIVSTSYEQNVDNYVENHVDKLA